ncbi:unnamed protein product [Eruca vesicaria subsp. sativa]|uniref:Uncharacterized protein n=1 Tax=Eruca vesicaria subsp. sativa TaxID=29727 RepID=A0ABC8JXR1_ERUVS|nr:unnamed protein product [Eruca vesicaria subsp. sativa]CAH8346673.1 unnamed protein product [Eruca vesicaria subsp. sativa]
MSTKSIILPFLLLIILVSTSQASRQLWEGLNNHLGSKSGLNGIPGFHGKVNWMNPTHTCTMQGPCQGKKLTCPAECYKSSNVNKEGYQSKSKSGGCSFDCTKKCIASC